MPDQPSTAAALNLIKYTPPEYPNSAARLIEVTIGLWPDNDPPGQRPPLLAAAIVKALHDEGYAITRAALCARSGGCGG